LEQTQLLAAKQEISIQRIVVLEGTRPPPLGLPQCLRSWPNSDYWLVWVFERKRWSGPSFWDSHFSHSFGCCCMHDEYLSNKRGHFYCAETGDISNALRHLQEFQL